MKHIKKITQTLIIIVAIAAMLVSCDMLGGSAAESVSVTYVYNNGEEDRTEQAELLTFGAPDEPTRAGYKFVGWCTDSELTEFYSFSIKPKDGTVLYAKWEPDYEYLQREVTTRGVLANVKVETLSPDIFASKSTQGSGIIFLSKNGYCYALTNYHVTAGAYDGFGRYIVTDAYGNDYTAEYVGGDVNYDLAVVRFRTGSGVKLQTLKIDARIPSNNEVLICLGTPNGRLNTVTYGNAENYKSVDIGGDKTESNVGFDVLWLNAYAEHGSSGCAILDTDLDVVGITYAVATDKSGEFKFTLAVPAEKINEFLGSLGIAG